eukprot:758577-Hanusia_phi.AAC.2
MSFSLDVRAFVKVSSDSSQRELGWWLLSAAAAVNVLVIIGFAGIVCGGLTMGLQAARRMSVAQ